MKRTFVILNKTHRRVEETIAQTFANIIISELTMINGISDESKHIPQMVINMFDKQFQMWLMWGVTLDFNMSYKGIYLK